MIAPIAPVDVAGSAAPGASAATAAPAASTATPASTAPATTAALAASTAERSATPAEPPAMISRERLLMGGRVAVHLAPDDAIDPRDTVDPSDDGAGAATVLGRISRWADRLTRFDPASELSRLNGDPRTEVPIGPTLAAVLDWGREAEVLTDGIVDIGLLDERIAAEEGTAMATGRTGSTGARSRASRGWSLDRRARGAVVRRPAGLRFDLDGVAKGWLADRALACLGGHAAAVVDADGDIAVRLDQGVEWTFGVADPEHPGHDLAELRLSCRDARATRPGAMSPPPADVFGLATSGTSVHRWDRGAARAHHLIDPRTGRPALTDIVQATVLTGSARVAEALAKAAVIVGSEAAFALFEPAGIDGAILLTERGRLLVHPATARWLA